MKEFKDLVSIVKKLRGPQGCPWDKEQTYASLTKYIIEEAYELVDAIKKQSFLLLKEELGDVLLHVVMLSGMAAEEGHFTIKEVIEEVSTKMIRRHPHVFADTKLKTAQEVCVNWEKIKDKEKEIGLLDSIPQYFPALMRADKVQQKAAKVGFDWPDIQGPLEKCLEEVQELKTCYEKTPANKEELTVEFGDILFSLVNLARKMDLDPEAALQMSNEKFITRFQQMEALIKAKGLTMSALSINELEDYWQQVKQSEY
jgi:tetrapyrrole methylase family protein/MazG family protein